MPVIKELPAVPAERALKVISGRWKVYVLYFLFESPQRLSELKRLIPDAPQKVIIRQLRDLEEHGIVQREVFAEVPPRVVYTLTKLGRSLQPLVGALCDWGKHHKAELARASSVPPSPRPRAAPRRSS